MTRSMARFGRAYAPRAVSRQGCYRSRPDRAPVRATGRFLPLSEVCRGQALLLVVGRHPDDHVTDCSSRWTSARPRAPCCRRSSPDVAPAPAISEPHQVGQAVPVVTMCDSPPAALPCRPVAYHRAQCRDRAVGRIGRSTDGAAAANEEGQREGGIFRRAIYKRTD
jgi:hypothetical protein